MNRNQSRTRCVALFLLALCCSALFAAHAPAATTTTLRRLPDYPKPALDGQRFLFVVDISSGMKSLDTANRQALFDLIFTGVQGQMRTGDSFGLWLFNDELRAGQFPMQVWVETNALASASLAAKYLREQKYSGKSRPDLVVPRLLNLVKAVRDVNVILLSNGETPLHGMPFETNIVSIYERRKADRKKEEKPFVTALVARAGEIVSGAVVLAGEPFELPERPAVALAVSGGTNTTANATNALAARPAATAPVQAGGLPKKKVIQIVSKTNTAPVSTAAAPAPAPANVVVAATPQTNPPAPAAAPAPVTPLPSLFSDPMPVAARERALPPDAVRITPASETPAPSPATPAVVAMPAGPGAGLFLAIGGSLLAGCLVLLFLVLRRGRRESTGSFITQSMGRD